MRTHLLTRGCGIVAALTLLGAGARAQFADYTRRVPVTIKNNGTAATPTPTSAEVILPGDAAMRADQLDIRVGYNNGSGIQEIDSKIFRDTVSETPANRVVFRLQSPIPAGGQSAGQYYVYYGNPSPTITAKRDLKKVFDHVVDFKSEANVVGQPAPDWDVQVGNTVTVEQYQGGKVGVLKRGPNHPRATVKQSAMPAFLNPEILAHIAPKGGGEREMAPMARVVANPADSNFQGGYAYGVDGFGSNSVIVSYVNPAPGTPYSSDPSSPMASVPDVLQADQYENILYRVTGDPGLIQGKNWTDGSDEPAAWMIQANRADFQPSHNGTPDPVYNQPGTTGMAGYLQDIAMDYIALRELRDLNGTGSPAETLTPTGPFIQGTISSTNAEVNPLTIARVHITGPGGYDQTFAVGPNGEYRVSLPAGGSYTVTASAKYHSTQVANNVSPTASATTNIVLPYTGAKFQGVVRDIFSGKPLSGFTVVAVDSNGHWQGSAKSDANGRYSFLVEEAGNLSIAALSVGIGNNDPGSGLGERKAVTVAPASVSTVNFAVQPPINGDFEIPSEAGTTPYGWSTNPFTPKDPPGAYIYTTDQNHTPGGQYSIAVNKPTADYEAWIPAGFQWATVNPNANYKISVWVYFTQAGQRARLRVRTLDAAGNDLNIAQPGGGAFITAGAPDATTGLQAPVGQWTKVETTVPANPSLAKLDNRLYVVGPGPGGIATGTVYFDDYAVTATPIASALGRLVDADGQPVADAYVGPLVADLISGQSVVWQGPYSVTDADGNFGIYPAQTGEVSIAAFKLPPVGLNGVIPDYGYVVDPATGKLDAAATPGARKTVRLLPAGNVMAGAAATAQDATGKDMSTDGSRPISLAVDNNVDSRWASPAPDAYPVTATFTMPKVEQVDQIEILWELADPSDITISLDDGSGVFLPLVDQAGAGSLGIPSGAINYSAATEGTTDILRFPAAQSVKAVQINGNVPRSGLNNFSILEIRALSLATPPVIPITNADVQKALKIAGGLEAATTADKARLDADNDGKITVMDAAALRRSIP